MSKHRLDTWWKERSKLTKILICFFVLAATFSISFLICKVIDLHFGPDDICLTEQCIEAAGGVLSSMDETVDPCQNFYRFACGNYIKKSFISGDRGSVSHFVTTQDTVLNQIHVILEEKNFHNEPKPFALLKKFYRACKNTTLIERHGLNIAKKLLDDLGGWPILDVSWNETEFDWIDTIAKLRATGLSISSLISVSVARDFKNNSKRILRIGEPVFGLNKQHLVKEINNTLVTAYYDYMVDIAEMFGADRAKASEELLDVINLEIQLAKNSVNHEDVKPFNVLTIKEMEKKYNKIPWLKLINSILPPQTQVNRNEPVSVTIPKLLQGFAGLMNRTPKRIKANYMMWRVVNSIISYLNQKVKDRKLILNSAVYGIQDRSPRWKECVGHASTLSLAAGASYVRKHFHPETKENAFEMVKYIKHQVEDMLGSVDWLDKKTRKNALDKAGNIVFHIGYPDELLDDEKIEAFYNKLDIDETQFLYSALNISKFLIDFKGTRLREPVNKTDWRDHDYSTTVNAFYKPNENSIILPAAILQGVFFNKDRPKYMNFGAIGSIIGHEITHAFDNKGSQFDKTGNLFNWWNIVTQNEFFEKAVCMVEQYNNFSVPEVKMEVNGLRTLGENIADNGGVKQTYLAYKNWQKSTSLEKKLPGLKYSQNQLYWLSAAQVWCSNQNRKSLALRVMVDAHSPSEFRVLGFLQNSEYFAKDYNCPLGSEMNPKDKCNVW